MVLNIMPSGPTYLNFYTCMKYIYVLLFVFIAPIAIAQQQDFYIGAFQSNEEMTLKSMEAMTVIPEAERKNYRDNFFGELVNEFRYDAFTTYFSNKKPESPNFINADIRVIAENTIRIKYFHQQRGDVVRELKFENDCYSILVTVWQFKEYFCRIK